MADTHGHRKARLALAAAAAAVACWITVVSLIVLTPAEAVAQVASIGVGEGTAFALAWIAFPIVGTIIVRRRPGNEVGWLCVLGGLQVALVALVTASATWSLAREPGSQPGIALAWLSHLSVNTIIAFPLLIMMRFPSGRPIGPAWRRVERASLVVIASLVFLLAIEPMPLFGFPTTPNPVGIGDPRITALGPASMPLFWLVPFASSVGALVVRYRRGSSLERVQIRWLAAASVVVGSAAISMPLTSPDLTLGRMSTVSAVAFALGFAAIPAAIGIAIVRHQLYDIDRLVKRTLVYAGVSAILAVVYAVSVLALTPLLGALSPGAGNTLVTAGSTLLAAALFRPVRARAQAVVDRRFDRERFEGARMIESFSSQVRSEVELDGVVGHLLAAATRTVHPAATACWIRARTIAPPALVGSADNP